MNKKSEKKRCSNFSTFEIDLLIKLVEERRGILKCPKLDAITVEKRNNAWREITQIFNDHEAINVYRDEDKLKKKYSNIRCERNKMGKQTIKPEEIAQRSEIDANDNAVADIVIKVDKADKADKMVLKENNIGDFNYTTKEPTDECSDYMSETSSIADDDNGLPHEQNENDKHIQQAANKLAETNSNIIMEKSSLELEIMATEHQERLKYMRLKHENEKKRIELQKMKYHLELELLNVEIAVKRKKLQSVDCI